MTRQITINKDKTDGFAARIRNRGQSQGTQTVELYKDGVLVTDQASLTLTPDETAYVLEAPSLFSDNIYGDMLTIDIITENMTRTVEVYIGGLPESVIDRISDDNTFTVSNKVGAQIYTNNIWSDFGAEISSNTSGITTAYIYRVSDGVLKGQKDISTLSAGDTFVMEDVNLQPFDGTDATKYNFVVDAGGVNYTFGFADSDILPLTSSDGDLTWDKQAANNTGTVTTPEVVVFKRIGNVGFP